MCMRGACYRILCIKILSSKFLLFDILSLVIYLYVRFWTIWRKHKMKILVLLASIVGFLFSIFVDENKKLRKLLYVNV